MGDYTFFSKDPSQLGEGYQLLWGHSIFPLLEKFQVTQVTQPELSSLTCSGAWGDAEKFCSDLAFLLISPKKAIVGEMVFGLAVVWYIPNKPMSPISMRQQRNSPYSPHLVKIGCMPLCGSMKMLNMFASLRKVNLAL